MLTKSPELKTTNPFDHIDANTTMDATSKRTDTGPHESLVSEAASTLAHLATVAGVMSPSAGTNTAAAAGEGINTSIRIPPLPSIPGSRIEPPAPLSRPDDGKARQAATAEGASVAELIKEAVLRRLSRPEDIVKRNMFAVEGKSIKFPVKLMYLLDECNEFQSIISWAEDGLSFIIHDPNAFEDKVLPKIFKEARFSSFLRKLTRWGFMKKSTPFGIKFFQRKFQKGNYSLCIDITCCNKGSTVIRGRGSFDSTNPDSTSRRSSSFSNNSNTAGIINEDSKRSVNENDTDAMERHDSRQGVNNSNFTNSVANAPVSTSAMNNAAMFAMQRGVDGQNLVSSRHDADEPVDNRASDQHANPIMIPDHQQNLRLLNEIALARRNNNVPTNSDQLETQLNLQELLRRSRASAAMPHLLNQNQRDLLRDQQEADLVMEILRNRELGLPNHMTNHPMPQETMLHSMLQQQSNAHSNQDQKYLEMLRLMTGSQGPPHDGNMNPSSLLPLPSQHPSNRERIHSQIMSTALEGLISSQNNSSGAPHPDFALAGASNSPRQLAMQRREDAIREMLIEENALAAAAAARNQNRGLPSGGEEDILREQLLRQLSRSNMPEQGNLMQMQQYQHEYPLTSNAGSRNQFRVGPSMDEILNSSQGVPSESNNVHLLLEMIRRKNQP